MHRCIDLMPKLLCVLHIYGSTCDRRCKYAFLCISITPDSAGVWSVSATITLGQFIYLWPHLPCTLAHLSGCVREDWYFSALPLKWSRTWLLARGLLLARLSSFISDIQEASWHFPTTESTRPFAVPPPQPRESGGNKPQNELTFAAGGQVWLAKKWNPLRENATVGAGGAFSPPPSTSWAQNELCFDNNNNKKGISFDVFEFFYAKLILP